MSAQGSAGRRPCRTIRTRSVFATTWSTILSRSATIIDRLRQTWLMLLGLILVAINLIPGVIPNNATSANAADENISTEIVQVTPDSQKTGSLFDYRVFFTCSSTACTDATVTIPLPTINGKPVPTDGDDSWRVSLDHNDPNIASWRIDNGQLIITMKTTVNAGTVVAGDLLMTPPNRVTPNNTKWTVQSTATAQQAGKQVTVTAPNAVTSTATAEYTHEASKTMYAKGTRTPTVFSTDGGLVDVSFSHSVTVSERGSVDIDPAKPLTFTDVLPQGMEYVAAQSTPTVNGKALAGANVKYNTGTRTLTVTVPAPLPDGDVTVGGLTFNIPDLKPFYGKTISNTVTARSYSLGSTQPSDVKATDSISVFENFKASASLRLKKTGTPNNGQGFTDRWFTESADGGRTAKFTLSAAASPTYDYEAKFLDRMPCYTTDKDSPEPELTSGREPDICQDPVVQVKSITGRGLTGPITIKVTYKNGSSQNLTVSPASPTVTVKADLVKIETQFLVKANPSATPVDLVLDYRIPDTPEIAGDTPLFHGDKFHNVAHGWARNVGESDWGDLVRLDSQVTIWLKETTITPIAYSSYQNRIDAQGRAAYTFKAGSIVGYGGGSDDPLRQQTRRTVILLPKGLEFVFSGPLALANNNYTVGGNNNNNIANATAYQNYQGTGRPAIEIINNGLSLDNVRRLIVQNAEPGVYPFDVYSSIDTDVPLTCRPVKDPTASKLQLAPATDPIHPDWWPKLSDGTTPDVCKSSSSVTLFKSAGGYDVTKAVTTDPTAKQLKTSGSPSVSTFGGWNYAPNDGSPIDPVEVPVKPDQTDGGEATYLLRLTNLDAKALTEPVMYDMLPNVTDGRGSTAKAVLTAAPQAYTGWTVYYTRSINPCMPEINRAPQGCDDDWTSTRPPDLSQVTGLKFQADSNVQIAAGNTIYRTYNVRFESANGKPLAGTTVKNDVTSHANLAPNRQSPTSAQSVVTFQGSVVPVPPTILTSVCGVPYQVKQISPKPDYIKAVQTKLLSPTKLQVTYVLNPGFNLAGDAVAQWTFDVPSQAVDCTLTINKKFDLKYGGTANTSQWNFTVGSLTTKFRSGEQRPVAQGTYRLSENFLGSASLKNAYTAESLVCVTTDTQTGKSTSKTISLSNPVVDMRGVGKNVVCTFTNADKPPSLRFDKVDGSQVSTTYLGGSQWTLTGPTGSSTPQTLTFADCGSGSVSSCVSSTKDSNPARGRVLVDGAKQTLQWGTYTLTETAAPPGFQPVRPISVNLVGGQTTNLGQIVDLPITRLVTWTKTNADTTPTYLGGSEWKIQIQNVNGSLQPNPVPLLDNTGAALKDAKGQAVTTITDRSGSGSYAGADQDPRAGYFRVNLKPLSKGAQYVLVETKAPRGFLKTTKETSLALTTSDASFGRIINNQAPTLMIPLTGGTGTDVFVFTSLGLVAIGTGTLVLRHRRRRR